MSDWLLLWPWVLWAALLPLLIAVVPAARPQPAQALRVPFVSQLRQIQSVRAGNRFGLGAALALLAWLLLVVAASRPVELGEPVQPERSGRDLMLAVDLSGSMSIEDMEFGGRTMNRLDALKILTADFIQRREGDRLGLVLFGARAYLQTPLTFDLETVGQHLQESVISLAGRETAIGDAIGLAVKRLREREDGQRTLILLTDGANNSGELDPARAAELAQMENIRVHAIGFGAEEMVVRDFFGSRVVNPSNDLDEDMLKRITDLTGGVYVRAKDTEGLAAAYRLFDRIEPIAEAAEPLRPQYERAHWFLAIALLIAALVVVGRTRREWQWASLAT